MNQKIQSLERIAVPVPEPEKPLPKPKPYDKAVFALYVLIFFCTAFINADLSEIFDGPRKLFVAKVDGRFQIWNDAEAHEADTGKSWTDAPPSASELLAPLHGSRSSAVFRAALHITILSLAAYAIWSLKKNQAPKPIGQ